MKTLIKVLFFFLIFSSSCSKDKCADVNCLNNGTCINGNCECLTGYSGANCGIQITPRKIKITNIKLTKFPATDNGAGWDLTSGPDIFIVMTYNQNLIYNHSSYYSDANPQSNYDFQPNINLYLENPVDEYVIALYDYDSFDDNDFMGGIRFTPYFDTNNFPNIIYLDAGGDVSFEISVSYSF